MQLVIKAVLEDGEDHEVVIDEVGETWRAAFEEKRHEAPGALLTFFGTLDGGHPQMWALRAGAITSMTVEA
jgi:hypothetical protein